ncbi:MAG: asparagine synthase-related protein [Steroidobacteraceae bacterium]
MAKLEKADKYRAMLLLYVCCYLPEDLLVKVDRAAMHYSLETREPFLDHRLYEYSAALPTSYLVDEAGGGKRILRHLLHKYVPRKLVDRPKAGFAAPLAQWLRQELADWAESLVYGPELAAQSLIIRFICGGCCSFAHGSGCIARAGSGEAGLASGKEPCRQLQTSSFDDITAAWVRALLESVEHANPACRAPAVLSGARNPHRGADAGRGALRSRPCR